MLALLRSGSGPSLLAAIALSAVLAGRGACAGVRYEIEDLRVEDVVARRERHREIFRSSSPPATLEQTLAVGLHATYEEIDPAVPPELLALRFGIDATKLRILNGREPRDDLPLEGLVCRDRYHRLLPGETLEQLAEWYACSESTLRELNGWNAETRPEAFSRVLVPGFRSGRAMEGVIRRVAPVLDAEVRGSLISRVTTSHAVQIGEDLASIARERNVPEPRLRYLNRLEGASPERPLPPSLVIEARAHARRDAELVPLVVALEWCHERELDVVLRENQLESPEELLERPFSIPTKRPKIDDVWLVH